MRAVFLFALLPFVGGAQADSVASIGFEGLDRHLFDPAACYDKIAETGVKRARIQSGWCLCEPAKGVYDFSELDAVVSNLTVRGIEPWMMVGFGNTNWMGACHSPAAVGCVPLYYGPECRAAWERFVAKLAARYAKQVRHWEIWNEPDIGHFWQPRQPSAADYAELVKLTGAIIRREAPGAKIGGVCSTVLNAWLREAVKLAANDVDFWCVHAYGICPERTRGVQRDPNGKVMDYCDQIAELKSLFAAAGRPQVEIWQGEAGFPSWFRKDHWLLGRNPEGYGCEEWQAKWLLRRFLTDRRAGCACSSFYAAADICRSYSMATTTQTHPAEHGLLASRRGYARKASHRAFSVYNATLAEAKFVGSRTDGDVIVDEYDAAGRRLIAYYRPDDIRENRPETVWTNGVSLVPSGGFLTDLLTGAVSARPRELPLRDYPLLWSAESPFRSPRLFFAGDSTLDDAGLSLGGKANDPYRSWGTTLGEWMVPGASVANYARSGASTKSFDESGRWDLMMKSVSSGDFVVIQFGHNDQKFSSKNRWAPPQGLFREIVRKWVAQLRERGARPILVSPICRGTFDGKGRLVDRAPKADGPCLRDYRDALCELAEELHCDFVDMNTLTRGLLERVGRDEAMKFFVISTGLILGKDGEPSKDTTHPVRAGAEAFARLFLDDVRKRNLAVSALFREDKGRNESHPYPWRGLMLDESRFFFGKQVVKETLDRMADCGLNVFHWHLTDDQGWRLEIKGCPELTTVGAFRKSSPKVHTEADPDGKPYGPFFYTEADVRDVVAYASARGIRVVPEIELPGHIGALLTARPEFSCRGEVSPDQICSMAIYEDVLCVGNDAAIRYLERVLDEVCRLFPDEVVHIGGDECPTARWEACPKCRARMKAAGIGKVRGLQSWVTHHFARYLQKKGKRAMGWDEILEGDGCPSNVIVQTWREPDPRRDGGREPAAVRAARLGHDVVLSPLKTLYFSLPAGPDDPGEYRKPVASYAKGFGYVTPEKVRAFCPTKGFPPELAGRILGAECCCWSEGTRTGPILHQKTWPRAAIFAATLTNAGGMK